MNTLTEKAFEQSRTGIFTYTELLVWFGDNRSSIKGLVKRAIASGEILHIRRGLYCLSNKYNRYAISRNVFANLIYGPSYISMETALSEHGWIPEAVHSVISVSMQRAKSFQTPLGYYDYVQIKQYPLYCGVERMMSNVNGVPFFLAKPLKALVDYVVSRRLDWTGREPLEESLRIEPECLETLTTSDFDELENIYKSRRAKRFLTGLKKELCK